MVRQVVGRGRWAGTVAQAGVVLPWLLADRLGLCTELAGIFTTERPVTVDL